MSDDILGEPDPNRPVVTVIVHVNGDPPTVLGHGDVDVVTISSYPISGFASQERTEGFFEDYADTMRGIAAHMEARGADEIAEATRRLADQFVQARMGDPDWQEYRITDDRARLVVRWLGERIDPFRLYFVDPSDTEWLSTHAGGFESRGQADGLEATLAIMPERICQLGAHLDDDDFELFVLSIRTWQHATSMDFTLQVPHDLILATFMQDHPAAADTLLSIAAHHHINPLVFHGLTQPAGQEGSL